MHTRPRKGLGWYKIGNRTARLYLTAKSLPVAHPSAYAYQDGEIDELDLQIASRSTPPKLLKKKRWVPQWTNPFRGAARYKERAGFDYAPLGEEPPEILQGLGSDPEDREDDEVFDVD